MRNRFFLILVLIFFVSTVAPSAEAASRDSHSWRGRAMQRVAQILRTLLAGGNADTISPPIPAPRP